jgi:molybdopterin/thiamine biosynthesis adenylyltransferase
MHNLTASELQRYSRHLVLRDFGVERQMKLRNAKILVVGAGGLGCPALLYLAAAGVGTIGIIDSDNLEVSNLQRQVLYTVDDLGQNKARAAANRLRRMNPHVEFVVYEERLTSSNAREIVGSFDLVIDGTDNFPTVCLRFNP